MKNAALLIGFIVLFNLAYAQNKLFNLGCELRPRLLLDDGYKTPKLKNKKPLAYITQRTRLNVGFQKNILEAYISVQDIRFWGGDNKYKENGVLGNTESLSLHQGWFMFNPNQMISIKIGRQLFQYDDQRILSSRNWNDYQITYDAVLLKFDDAITKLDIGLTWNSETSKNLIYPDEKFKVFDFIRYERQLYNFNLSIIGLLTGNTINDSVETIFLCGTYGLNLNYIKKGFKMRSSVYYQNNLNNNGQNINAYCFSIFAKQNIFQKKASIGIGLDYLSGNDETNINNDYQSTNHRFDILYGRRHSWYGYMDFFSTTPEQGLQDYMIKTEYIPIKNLTLQADYHFFLLAENKYNIEEQTVKLSKNLGSEFDFTLKWKILEEASLQAGYSFYLMTNSLKQIKEVRNEKLRFPQFAYVMITVKPILFDIKNSQPKSHTHLQFTKADTQPIIAKEYVSPTLKNRKKE
ncbi:MAG: alginate export family protein [Bacteroidales bacterium]|nr:alginate export family protein [Bacteroidales bacterium]